MEKRVLITGGSRGIGRAIAARFADSGYEVITPTREQLDLSSTASIQQYVQQNGGLQVDTLVNNAGENIIAPLQDLSLATWERVLTVNLTAPFLLIQAAIPYMKAQQYGRIVSISSMYSLVSRAGRAPYSASKAGLNGLTRTAAIECAPANILINTVCPGFVETDMTRQNNTNEQIQQLAQMVPMQRLATPDEMAEFVFFLGSEHNTYITGQALPIDGGFTSQ